MQQGFLTLYLKGTLNHGLLITRSRASRITACSDANWVGNLDDNTLTTGYIVYLGQTQLHGNQLNKIQW